MPVRRSFAKIVVRYLEPDVGCNTHCSKKITFMIRFYEIQHILVNSGDLAMNVDNVDAGMRILKRYTTSRPNPYTHPTRTAAPESMPCTRIPPCCEKGWGRRDQHLTTSGQYLTSTHQRPSRLMYQQHPLDAAGVRSIVTQTRAATVLENSTYCTVPMRHSNDHNPTLGY
jgi:hypothetical protein